jgi:hypothetical protein
MDMRLIGNRRSVLGALSVSLLVAGCSAAASAPSTQAPAATAAVATTAAVAPTQVVQASAAPRLLEEGAPLSPGRYYSRFDPGFTVTFIRGVADVSGTSWIDYNFGHDPSYELFINRIDKVPDLKHPGGLLDPPTDLIGWLANVPGRTALGSPQAVKVGGLDAQEVDVTTSGDDAWPGQDADSSSQVPPGLPGHHTVRMIVVDVNGHDVLISYQAQESGTAHFYAAVTAFQALIDTIAWN